MYVIRDEPTHPLVCPLIASGQPHGEEHGSIEEEMIAHMSHTHALFCDNSAKVYYHLEEAMCGTPYSSRSNAPKMDAVHG